MVENLFIATETHVNFAVYYDPIIIVQESLDA